MARSNPLPSYHEAKHLESYVALVERACGCSRKTAEKVASAYPMGYGLGTAQRFELEHIGLRGKQAERLEAVVELCRYLSAPGPWVPSLRGPEDVAKYVKFALGPEEQESFLAILIDTRQRVIDVREIAKGSLAQVDVHPREVFRDAIRLRAHSIILAHNHPSGDPQPSDSDVQLTRRLAEVGRLVGIPVLDHLIIAKQGHTSLAGMGVIG